MIKNEQVPPHKIREMQIVKEILGKQSFKKALIVGCGQRGYECVILAEMLAEQTVGIDINLDLDQTIPHPNVTYIKCDASSLDIEHSQFDLVYCYHVLEHIPDYGATLAEIRRLLKEDGLLYLGVPNKDRLIGYISSEDVTMMKRIKWNLTDWLAKLKGDFENEKGAHAGFKRAELKEELNKRFSKVEDVTLQYFRNKYPNKLSIINFLEKTGLSKQMFPSIYFLARK